MLLGAGSAQVFVDTLMGAVAQGDYPTIQVVGLMDDSVARLNGSALQHPAKDALVGHDAPAHLAEDGAPVAVAFLAVLGNLQFHFTDNQAVKHSRGKQINPMSSNIFRKIAIGKGASSSGGEPFYAFQRK